MNAMKKLYYLALAAAVSIAAISCDQQVAIDEIQPSGKTLSSMTFLASNGPAVRTYLDAGSAVKWFENDTISVFDGTDVEHNRKFGIESIDGSGVATFKGAAEACATYYAAYPYAAANYATAAGKVRIEIAAAQTASAAGSFGNGCNPSVAVLKDGMFTFYNVAGLLKFTLSHDNVTAITVTAKDGGAVGGEYLVAFNADGSIDEANSSRNADYTSVSFSVAEGTLAAATYFIPVVPRTYTGGVTVALTLADGTTKTIGTTDNVIVQRSKITNLGTFKTINGVNFPVIFPVGWNTEDDKGFYDKTRTYIAQWIADPACSTNSGSQKTEWTGQHGKVVSAFQPQAYLTWNWADAIATTGVKHFIEIVNNKGYKIGGFGVKGAWTGDFYEFAIPVNTFAAGTTLSLTMPLFTRQGPAFWEVLYKDGEEWKSTATKDLEATDAAEHSEKRDATWVLTNGGAVASSTRNTNKTVSFTYTNALSDDYLYIRVKCVDGTVYYDNSDVLTSGLTGPVANASSVASATFYMFNPADRDNQAITISVVEP